METVCDAACGGKTEAGDLLHVRSHILIICFFVVYLVLNLIGNVSFVEDLEKIVFRNLILIIDFSSEVFSLCKSLDKNTLGMKCRGRFLFKPKVWT